MYELRTQLMLHEKLEWLEISCTTKWKISEESTTIAQLS